MASLYLILTSLIFPVLAISWLCCIACCIYRSLLRNLNKPGRRTKIQVCQNIIKVYKTNISSNLATNIRYWTILDNRIQPAREFLDPAAFFTLRSNMLVSDMIGGVVDCWGEVNLELLF